MEWSNCRFEMPAIHMHIVRAEVVMPLLGPLLTRIVAQTTILYDT